MAWGVRTVHERGELPDGRPLEQHNAQAAAEGGFDPGEEPDGQEGVAAEVEEVVVDTDARHAQHLLPDRRQQFLDRIARRDVAGSSSDRAATGAGRALRSSLPLEFSGKDGEA